MPQITAKETIFIGEKIDIDDHAEFYQNKYYFFLQDYQVFFSRDASLGGLRKKSVKKSSDYEIFSIDSSGRFWKVSNGTTQCIENFSGSVAQDERSRGEAKISYKSLYETSNEVRNVGMDRGKRFLYFVDMKRKGVFINTRYLIACKADKFLG